MPPAGTSKDELITTPINNNNPASPINHPASPRVHVKDGEVFANSRDVAEFFGKNHGDVLRDISVIVHSVALRPQICGVWFQETTYEQKTGFGFRENRCFDMTKDGFTLLVMGYTGAKAMQFKRVCWWSSCRTTPSASEALTIADTRSSLRPTQTCVGSSLRWGRTARGDWSPCSPRR